MALAEKIAKIALEQEQTKKQFKNELLQGLQQIDAYKTKEEVETQRKYDLETTTPTDVTTTMSDTGQQRVSKNVRGEAIKTETTIDERTPKPTGKEEIKSDGEIITYIDGKEVARTPQWKPEGGSDKKFNALQKARINKWVAGISEAEERVQKTQKDILYYNELLRQAGESGKGKAEIEEDGEIKKLTSKTIRRNLVDTIRQLDIDEEAIAKYEKKLSKMGLTETKEEETEEKTIVRTGISNGKKVVEYSDGSIEYAE